MVSHIKKKIKKYNNKITITYDNNKVNVVLSKYNYNNKNIKK